MLAVKDGPAAGAGGDHGVAAQGVEVGVDEAAVLGAEDVGLELVPEGGAAAAPATMTSCSSSDDPNSRKTQINYWR